MLATLLSHIGTKYLVPTSLRFWASFPVLLIGIFMALVDMHGLVAVTETIQSYTGRTAADLIQLGLLGLGITGIGQGVPAKT